jgi:hypothetical protein
MMPQKVVLVIHENGNKEFCRFDPFTGTISGSVGYFAADGRIELARKRLYKTKGV